MPRVPATLTVTLVALAGAVAFPLLATPYQMSVATETAVFAIFALGLSLVVTHAGLPSLGHAAFFGIGAYSVGLLTVSHLTNPLLVFAVSVTASALLTLVVGPILLRTRADYFLMASLALSQILFNLAESMTSVTGGDNGLPGIQRPPIGVLDLSSPQTYYYLCLAVLLLTAAIVGWIANAPFGHLLRAVRDNPTRSAALGTGGFALNLTALVLSAVISSLAGTLFAYDLGFVAPDSFSVATSGAAFLMVAIGGSRAVAGPIIGAVVVEGVAGLVITYTHRTNLVLGVIYVVIALKVLPAIQRLTRRWVSMWPWPRRTRVAVAARSDWPT